MYTFCNNMAYHSESEATILDFLRTLSDADKLRKPLDADGVLKAVIELVLRRGFWKLSSVILGPMGKKTPRSLEVKKARIHLEIQLANKRKYPPTSLCRPNPARSRSRSPSHGRNQSCRG